MNRCHRWANHKSARRAQLDLQEALRQLLRGEPPPRAPQPPPIPLVMREAQPAEVWPDEEQFQPEQAWMDEPQETYEAATSTGNPDRRTFATTPRLGASECQPL